MWRGVQATPFRRPNLILHSFRPTEPYHNALAYFSGHVMAKIKYSVLSLNISFMVKYIFSEYDFLRNRIYLLKFGATKNTFLRPKMPHIILSSDLNYVIQTN